MRFQPCTASGRELVADGTLAGAVHLSQVSPALQYKQGQFVLKCCARQHGNLTWPTNEQASSALATKAPSTPLLATSCKAVPVPSSPASPNLLHHLHSTTTHPLAGHLLRAGAGAQHARPAPPPPARRGHHLLIIVCTGSCFGKLGWGCEQGPHAGLRETRQRRCSCHHRSEATQH